MLGQLAATPEALLAVLQQLVQAVQPRAPSTAPNLKYAFEYFKIGSELMDIFTSSSPVAFTKKACRAAPPFGGVYFVFRNSALIYVGRSDNLRRRLLEHVGGKSNFAKQLIGRFRPTHFAEFLQEHTKVSYREVDDPSFQRALEHVAIGVFQPIFNRD